MRVKHALALGAAVISSAPTVGAADECDSDCYRDNVALQVVLEDVDVPLNAQLLHNGYSNYGLSDSASNAVPIRTEEAGSGFEWLIPEQELQAETRYHLSGEDHNGVSVSLGSFTTGTDRDEEPPAGVEVTLQAEYLCSDIELMQASATTTNEPAFFAQFEKPSRGGSAISFLAATNDTPMNLCHYGADGDPFTVTVTLFDLAGNAAAPQAITVTPTGHDSGCAMGPGPRSRGGMAVGLALLLLAVRRRRRSR